MTDRAVEIGENPSGEEVRAQLGRLLASEEFDRAEKLRDLLRFVVESTLAGHADRIKGYTVATEVFGRDESFDPATDPIVRVQALRLRQRLTRYYGGAGASDPVVVDLPKGSHVPRFQRREGPTPPLAPEASAGADRRRRARPSVAVLPLTNLGGAEQAYLAHGLAEELSNSLALIQGLNVVAYYSCVRLADQGDLPAAGRALGAEYLITGSIRSDAGQIQIGIQLNEAATGKRVWGRSFDAPLDAQGLVSIRDDISGRIVAAVADYYGAVSQTLWAASRGKPVRDLTAYEALLQMHSYVLALDPEGRSRMKDLLERAVEVEPDFALAWAALGDLYGDVYAYSTGLSDAALEKALRRADECARRALEIDRLCQHAHEARAFVSVLRKERARAIEAAETTIALNPRAAFLVGQAGVLIAVAGDYDRGLACVNESRKLNPLHPGFLHFAEYLKHFSEGRYEAALGAAQKVDMPEWMWDPLLRAGALAQLGRRRKRDAALGELRRIQPDFDKRPRHYVSIALQDDALQARFLEGLDL